MPDTSSPEPQPLEAIEQRLRELVEKATPGEWAWANNWLQSEPWVTGKFDPIVWYTTDDDGVHAKPENRDYIAAACPDNVKVLLAELDRLRRGDFTDAELEAQLDAVEAQPLSEGEARIIAGKAIAASELDALRRRLDAVEGAAQPFAEMRPTWDDTEDATPVNGSCEGYPTVGDLRKLAAALEGK